MPRTDEQNQQIRDQRFWQILSSALDIYSSRGFEATDVGAVATRAGVARGLVFYYFKSKKGLFQALTKATVETALGVAAEILQRSGGGTGQNPLAPLVRYAWTVCNHTLDDPRFALFFMRLPFDAERLGKSGGGTVALEFQQKHSALIAGAIEEAMDRGKIRRGNPLLAANAYWGALILNLVAMPDLRGDRRLVIEELLSYCFEGLGGSHRNWRSTLRGQEANPANLSRFELIANSAKPGRKKGGRG